MLVISVQALLN